MTCLVCDDTGLLGKNWCPLCDGFGREDWLHMQHTQSSVHKGRLLLRRLIRVSADVIGSDEKMCIDQVLKSCVKKHKKQNPGPSRAPSNTNASPANPPPATIDSQS